MTPALKSPSPGTLDTARVRAEFPVLERLVGGKRLVYLDSACSALKSRRVADAVRDFYLNSGGCAGKRSAHLLSQEVEEGLTRARQSVARFLNADSPNCVVFTSGTTEGANWVARAFPYGERREVVLTELEHNSLFLPFFEMAEAGLVALKFCDSPGGELDLGRLKDLVTERTALVVMTHASNVAGGVQPVAEAVRIAHRRGAKVLVDDAQYLSSHREDVQATDADFVVFSAHKLGGPFGTGVLYGKERMLNGMRPHKVGGGTVRDVAFEDGSWRVTYLDAPQRFEAGVQNYPGILGLGEALALFLEWGLGPLRAHAADLVGHAFDRLSAVEGVRIVGRRERLVEGALVSFHAERKGFSLQDFNLYLNHELPGHAVAIRIGEHCAHVLHRRLGVPQTARLSFFAYNTRPEIDLFVESLEAYLSQL